MNPVGPIIHIVDDDKSYRTAVGRLMEASGFRVATYASGEELLAHLPSAEPGCILLDLQMPGLNGLELQDRLAEKAPLLPVVFLTGQGDIKASVQAMKAGAEDFLEKPTSREALLDTVRRALLHCDARRVEHDRIHALQARLESLTPRELDVFDLIVRGKLNKQIAYALGASERTIKAHRHNVMEKLGVRSLAEAVSIAERLGLLAPVSDPPAQQSGHRSSP
ncbi:response regulator transcription factor [Rhizobium sp. BK251]|uniref:response regulator transcription factor n=1 Tax=Rhizobium sp. BK251 TaxID=2512125 RepID=UPI00104F5AD4|nr:response regulator transcription factor [Rhizobium sp. BK251]TCL71363.1 LuxR family two component transcriptional regulator [Rhizobium sp. BK251]